MQEARLVTYFVVHLLGNVIGALVAMLFWVPFHWLGLAGLYVYPLIVILTGVPKPLHGIIFMLIMLLLIIGPIYLIFHIARARGKDLRFMVFVLSFAASFFLSMDIEVFMQNIAKS